MNCPHCDSDKCYRVEVDCGINQPFSDGVIEFHRDYNSLEGKDSRIFECPECGSSWIEYWKLIWGNCNETKT